MFIAAIQNISNVKTILLETNTSHNWLQNGTPKIVRKWKISENFSDNNSDRVLFLKIIGYLYLYFKLY